MHKFVADAGPFIHLEQIGQLKLLKNLPEIYIPASVIQEINQGSGAANPIRGIKRWPNIRVVPVQRKPLDSKAAAIISRAKLQRGEIDCIYLTLRIPGRILLSDDLNARVTAESLSLEVHGSIGIIAYGFRRKWFSLETAEESLNLLYHRSSLFITYAIIEEAIRSLRKSA